MLINEIPEKECREVLARATVGRLACSHQDQPYVIPTYLAYDDGWIYVFATFGKKIEWMRENPKVCVEVEEVAAQSEWVSVIANGRYEELAEPQFTTERAHARKLLEKRHHWWINALAERRMSMPDQSVEPIFFRIHVTSVTGLRGEGGDGA
jgi:uncharacterized protein